MKQTEETLVINQTPFVQTYIDELDKTQSTIDLANRAAQKILWPLKRDIDSKGLVEVNQTTNVIDNADNGGNSGDGYALSSSNIRSLFTIATRKLEVIQTDLSERRIAVISPEVKQFIVDDVSSRAFEFAGKVTSSGTQALNGYLMNYLGFDVYVSNLIPSVLKASYSGTNPSNGDTFVIRFSKNGELKTYTFTFVSTIGTTAGNVLIGTDSDATATNLVAAINNFGGGSSTGANVTYVPFPQSDKDFGYGITASVDTAGTGGTVTVVFRGFARCAAPARVGTTYTTNGNGATSGVKQMNLFGVQGCIKTVLQKEPNVQINKAPDALGHNYLGVALHDSKAFKYDLQRMVRAEINALTYLS
jgi:hypothetical protein